MLTFAARNKRSGALGRPVSPLTVAGAAVALASVMPVAYLLVVAAGRGVTGTLAVLAEPATREVAARSLGLALAVAATATPVGVALAWLVARSDLPLRRGWHVAAVLPLAFPTYVPAFALLHQFPSLTGVAGAWLVLSLSLYPLVYLPVAITLSRVDPACEETGRSLGDGPWKTFGRVTLPLVRPAAATGALLVILGVLSDFGAVAAFRLRTFTTSVYLFYISGLDHARGAVLACTLLVFTGGVVFAEGRFRGIARRHSSGRASGRRPATVGLGRLRWPLLAVPVVVAAGALGVPAVSLSRGFWRVIGDQPDYPALLAATRSSLAAAGWGALVTVVAALPVAYLAGRRRDRASRTIEAASYLAHALPGVVIALSVGFFAVRFAPFVYRRLPVLVFAYAVGFLPLALSVLYARMSQIPLAVEDVARSLGRGPRRVFASITGRLLLPAILAALVLVFVAGLKELPASLLIAPFDYQTLATQAWTASDMGRVPEAAVLPSVALVVAGVTASALILRRSLEPDARHSGNLF